MVAARPRSLIDRVVTVAALFFYSMPAFLLGVIMLYFLFYRLTLAGVPVFPGSGYVALTQHPIAWPIPRCCRPGPPAWPWAWAWIG